MANPDEIAAAMAGGPEVHRLQLPPRQEEIAPPPTEAGERLALALIEWIEDRNPGRAVTEAMSEWIRVQIRKVEAEAAQAASIRALTSGS